MPLTQNLSKKYKKAFQTENVKKGLRQNPMYLHTTYRDMMLDGNYDITATTPIIEILQTKGKETVLRYGAIDDFVFGFDPEPLSKAIKVENLEEVVFGKMSREDIARNYEEMKSNMPEPMVEPMEKPKEAEKSPMDDPLDPQKPDLRDFADVGKMSDEDLAKLMGDLSKLESEFKKPPELKRSKTSLRGGMRTPPEPTIPEAKLMRQESEKKLEETIESIPGELKPEAKAEPKQEMAEESKEMKMGESSSRRMEIQSGNPNVEMKVSKVEDPVQPSAIDLVPKERFVTEGKSVKQLKDDIRYFFKKFSKQLKNVTYDKNNNNLEYLQSKHKEIVAKLSAGKKEEKIGIIISGDEYIKQKLKEIILENSINALTTKDMIISIEGKEVNKTDEVGSYEFREGADGLPKAKNEPVYRHIPEVNEQGEKQRRLARIPTTATKYRGLETTAKEQVRNNPFSKPQKSIRFKYSY